MERWEAGELGCGQLVFELRRRMDKLEEGASLARALGSHWMVLMNRHGVTVAGSTVRQAVRAGDTEALCALVADRVARNGPAEVVSVLVKTDTIDAIEWYAGNRQPRDTVVHSACEIAR